MKRYSGILALALAASAASTSARAAWYEGWFDWFTPGEWTEGWTDGTTGFYAGGALNVTRATDPRFQRRIGGPGDGGPDATPDSPDDYTTEPAYTTTGLLRAGWKPFGWLALDAQIGTGLEEATVAEYVEASNGSRQTFRESTVALDMLYGVYLKPQLKLGAITVFGTAGYSGFEYSLTNPCVGRSTTEEGNTSPAFPDQPQSNPCFNYGGDVNALSEMGFAWGGGIQFNTSPATSISLEYTNHYDADENRVYGIGVNFNWFFLNDSGDDDYY